MAWPCWLQKKPSVVPAGTPSLTVVWASTKGVPPEGDFGFVPQTVSAALEPHSVSRTLLPALLMSTGPSGRDTDSAVWNVSTRGAVSSELDAKRRLTFRASKVSVR